MDQHYAIIHAGPKAPELKQLLKELDSVGAPEFYFMSDLVGTLKYDAEFTTDLNDLLYDMTEGEYYHHCLSNGEPAKHAERTQQFMFSVAERTKIVAQYLHTTLQNAGRYDASGKFPYEFHSFDGRVIYLRSL
jgi:hypothetical protein